MIENDWLFLALVPAMVLLGMVMKRVLKVSLPLLLLPFLIISFEMIFYSLFKLSSLSYQGLLFSSIGVFMLFYNYKMNYRYTIKQFMYRWHFAYSNVLMTLWSVVATYRIVLFFI